MIGKRSTIKNYMREIVKSNRIKYSVGSLGWINFYGIPVFLIIVGLFLLINDLQINNIDLISNSMTIPCCSEFVIPN